MPLFQKFVCLFAEIGTLLFHVLLSTLIYVNILRHRGKCGKNDVTSLTSYSSKNHFKNYPDNLKVFIVSNSGNDRQDDIVCTSEYLSNQNGLPFDDDMSLTRRNSRTIHVQSALFKKYDKSIESNQSKNQLNKSNSLNSQLDYSIQLKTELGLSNQPENEFDNFNKFDQSKRVNHPFSRSTSFKNNFHHSNLLTDQSNALTQLEQCHQLNGLSKFNQLASCKQYCNQPSGQISLCQPVVNFMNIFLGTFSTFGNFKCIL